MLYHHNAFDDLIEAFRSFPGVGEKTAQRMALFLIKEPIEKVRKLSNAMLDAKENIRPCSVCFLYTQQDPCQICADTHRDKRYICVIEQPNQAFVLERLGVFNGKYHVLMGKISPLEGIGPEQLHIAELVHRVSSECPEEIIVATGMDVEGEATSVYIANALKNYPVKVTRIAYGIPVGLGIDYADAQTLSRAIEGRRNMA
ncbi:MAG: recombination mediator RecR [Chlamydiota bacterium]|nr:recombination mediator RecR [Chlamydiota bacterium]